ncbi:MAG: hypothetical protein HRU35_08160, partial [Rickettsiaceae bacterium]|nr:hypothetical protein [Rickettsiaceae bacterium]
SFCLGGHTPLNRIDGDKPYYILGTVDEVLWYFYNKDNKSSHIEWTLSPILKDMCFIRGYLPLINDYEHKVENFFCETSSSYDIDSLLNCQKMSLKMLVDGWEECNYLKINNNPDKRKITGNLITFKPSFFDNSLLNKELILNVKYGVYRLSERLISDLALYYNIRGSIWDVIDKLYQNKIINEEALYNLKFATSYAAVLRHKVYSHYSKQQEKMSVLNTFSLENMDLLKKMNISKTFSIEGEMVYLNSNKSKLFRVTKEDLQENGNLFKYYCIMAQFYNELEKFCNKHDEMNKKQRKEFFQKTNFFDNSHKTKGLIHYKLLHYKQAKNHLELALKEAPNNITIKHLLSKLYMHFGNLEDAQKLAKKSLNQALKKHKNDDPLIISLTLNLADIYQKMGSMDNLLLCLNLQEDVYQIYEKLYPTKCHPNMAYIYHVMAITNRKLNDLSRALNLQKKSLEIQAELGRESTPEAAQTTSAMGITYLEESKKINKIKYKVECEKLQWKALKIYLDNYQGVHVDIVCVLNNIGISTYTSAGALIFHKKALQICFNVFNEIVPGVALSLSGISNNYKKLCFFAQYLEYGEQAYYSYRKLYGDDNHKTMEFVQRNPAIIDYLKNNEDHIPILKVGNVTNDIGNVELQIMDVLKFIVEESKQGIWSIVISLDK